MRSSKSKLMLALAAICLLGVYALLSSYGILKGQNEKKSSAQEKFVSDKENDMTDRTAKSKEELLAALTPLQYDVTQEKGTERPFTGKYNDFYKDGIYRCIVCGNRLFDSDTKFKSGSGWPSFWAPISNENVDLDTDRSLGMVREEVVCSNCGAHLGHVFNDGPQPTGLRYCINSAALDFEEEKDGDK